MLKSQAYESQKASHRILSASCTAQFDITVEKEAQAYLGHYVLASASFQSRVFARVTPHITSISSTFIEWWVTSWWRSVEFVSAVFSGRRLASRRWCQHVDRKCFWCTHATHRRERESFRCTQHTHTTELDSLRIQAKCQE